MKASPCDTPGWISRLQVNIPTPNGRYETIHLWLEVRVTYVLKLAASNRSKQKILLSFTYVRTKHLLPLIEAEDNIKSYFRENHSHEVQDEDLNKLKEIRQPRRLRMNKGEGRRDLTKGKGAAKGRVPQSIPGTRTSGRIGSPDKGKGRADTTSNPLVEDEDFQ